MLQWSEYENDTYFVYICRNNNDDKNDLFHGFNPEEQLEQVILDLFSAGVETLKTSILWSMVYMLHNPDVMKKVQDELDTVIGSQRLPTVKDMSKLTYTKATIYEIMRRSSVVPTGTTHSTVRYVRVRTKNLIKLEN